MASASIKHTVLQVIERLLGLTRFVGWLHAMRTEFSNTNAIRWRLIAAIGLGFLIVYVGHCDRSTNCNAPSAGDMRASDWTRATKRRLAQCAKCKRVEELQFTTTDECRGD